MKVLYYENLDSKKQKYIGKLNLADKYLLSDLIRNERISEFIKLSFYYRISKIKIYSNKKINAEIILADDSRIYYVKLSRRQRIRLYLMFRNHWFYHNWYTKLKIRYYDRMHSLGILSFIGVTLFKIIKGAVVLIAMLKACS